MGQRTRKKKKNKVIKSNNKNKHNKSDEDVKLITDGEKKIWTFFYALLFLFSIGFLLVYLGGLIKLLI